jgi:hypothetical protein
MVLFSEFMPIAAVHPEGGNIRRIEKVEGLLAVVAAHHRPPVVVLDLN